MLCTSMMSRFSPVVSISPQRKIVLPPRRHYNTQSPISAAQTGRLLLQMVAWRDLKPPQLPLKLLPRSPLMQASIWSHGWLAGGLGHCGRGPCPASSHAGLPSKQFAHRAKPIRLSPLFTTSTAETPPSTRGRRTMPKVAIVTGAARGIGRAIVRTTLARWLYHGHR